MDAWSGILIALKETKGAFTTFRGDIANDTSSIVGPIC